MGELCPVHNLPFKWVAPGVSKKTGKPYQGFWSCPEMGCKERPSPGATPTPQGWPAVRQQVAQKVAPEKRVMTREDWEARDRQKREWEVQKNKDILLQVAFKAAVEMMSPHLRTLMLEGKYPNMKSVYDLTLEYHSWLLSQTEGQSKPSVSNFASSEAVDPDLPPIEAYDSDPFADRNTA